MYKTARKKEIPIGIFSLNILTIDNKNRHNAIFGTMKSRKISCSRNAHSISLNEKFRTKVMGFKTLRNFP